MGVTEKRYGRWARVPHVMTVPFSFVTANQGAMLVYFSRPVTIKSFSACVTSAVAATDNGTLTLSNSTGNMASGVLTIPSSSAVGYQPTAVQPTTNQTIAAQGNLTITSSKTTSGGAGYVVIEYEDS
jgi:hypothetical protein